MRFFSNEAKDTDDQTGDRGHTPAEPTVPQQRAGSPWQHDTEPVPQPTAVGTSSVDDAAAARASDDPERTDRLPDTADRTVAFDDGAARDRDLDRDRDPDGVRDRDKTDEVAWPITADTTPDGPTVPAQGRTDVYREDRTDNDDAVDTALEDRGTFDDPHLTQPIPPRADATDVPAEKTAADKADDAKDRAEAAEVEAAEAKEQAEKAKAEPEPLIATAGTSTGAVSGASSFFPAADTQPLRDRWRDVQLRFVDDPKGATTDAAGLVDEAVDKLVQGLREQRGALAKGTDDTESLRVELRSYRDILDRLLGL
ncbi:hypothetical protein QLQ12_25390 [Actinoplanes sp. NEAU-A12]|uniref:Uncharacterized protein n=1 Tax=Actinoplanes sandaracinus TaxID=3045177 RepID=A0ABT6WQD4_9ACTN|nr:hypothetical protein [Actinoplanes sandaracinus]MDI6101957.1 hypothetical protein [Actinoplanes sandaracinus]